MTSCTAKPRGSHFCIHLQIVLATNSFFAKDSYVVLVYPQLITPAYFSSFYHEKQRRCMEHKSFNIRCRSYNFLSNSREGNILARKILGNGYCMKYPISKRIWLVVRYSVRRRDGHYYAGYAFMDSLAAAVSFSLQTTSFYTNT